MPNEPSKIKSIEKKQIFIVSNRLKQTKTTDEYNPYTGRQLRLLELEIDKLQTEADSYTNAPPHIVRTVWDRFVEFRKRRTDLEREVSVDFRLLIC